MTFKRAGSPRGEKGATLVESALVFTLFVFVVFGIMDFGRLVFAFNFVAYGAREGTRYASVRGSASGRAVLASDVKSYVARQAVALDSSKLTVNTTWSPNNSPGSTVKVNVSYSYKPMLGILLPGAVSIGSKSQMVISQ
jgi:Flp pilus assembly protein TadG